MSIRASAFALILSAAAVWCPLRAGAQETIRVGVLPFSESLAAVIADREGFFEEEGLDVELTKFDSGSLAVSVLQSGNIEIALSNTITTLQVIERGLDAVILAPGAIVRDAAPDTTTGLMVKKGTVESPKDLEGKRIAVNVINSSAWLHMVAYLDKHGVDYKSVQFAEVPFPQMNAPLLAGQLDAIGQVEPFRSALMSSGEIDLVGWTYVETAPGTDITQYIALRPWVEENRETVAKFVRALLRGAKFAEENEARTREINVEFTNLNPDFKDEVLLPRLGTEISVDMLSHTMEMMQKFGLLDGPVDISGSVFQP